MDEWSEWRWKDIEGGTITVYVDDTHKALGMSFVV